MKNVVNKYKLKNKFIAQTYEGASIMSGHLNGLQMKVQQEYHMALFTHCYAHVLNLVLSQEMAEISECDIFFFNFKWNFNVLVPFQQEDICYSRTLEKNRSRRLLLQGGGGVIAISWK